MYRLDVGAERYLDKVYGCWLGKNAGGTLGTPLEETIGRAEPFDVWWYPELAEGGMPNDDLEIQLVWLKAVEEVGPALRARDLARYWLDHIGYNFDEYGLSKTNLRLGLEPPLSGSFNNWFKDCMGCPIRSEIWACLAPAAPRVAVRYAYEDAILDHAGGESVHGEFFNAALESAAFVVEDRRRLVDIALSYVPPDSATAAAIRAAAGAHDEGADWLTARRRVLAAAPHYNAQYSPINLGFQVIGLLFGTDFGDGLCKTVNCGYDTDSSGAAIGSYLGILAGRSGLPARWIEPLGDVIATNEEWGGVRHLSDGPNPAPTTLAELAGRIRAAAGTVLRAHGVLGADGTVCGREEDLYADAEVARLQRRSPTRVDFGGPDVTVGVEHRAAPVAVPGGTAPLTVHLRNHRTDPLTALCALRVPPGWSAPEPQLVELPVGASVALDWTLAVPDRSALDPANAGLVELALADRPPPPAVPFVLAGAAAHRVAGPYDLPEDGADPLDTEFPPEQAAGPRGRPGAWTDLAAAGNAVPLAGLLDRPGVLYLQTFLHAPDPVDVWFGVESDCAVAVWGNGRRLVRSGPRTHVRPSYKGNRDTFASWSLRAGWNEALVKLVRTDADTAGGPECHLLLSTDDVFHHGLPEIGRTRFPWD